MIRIDPQRFPRPADPDRAKLGMERLLETAGAGSDRAAARRLAGNPTAKTLLSAVFGNSAYLTQSILRFPDIVASLLEDGPDAVFERIVATLRADYLA